MVDIVIVEGPDGAGKSTLVDALTQVTGLELSPASKLSKKERNEPGFRAEGAVRERVWQSVCDAVTGADAPVIHDRLFFSELIYSEVLGRQCAFPEYEARHILRLMNACRVPIIFCLPPFKEVSKAMLKTEQLDGAMENLQQIYNYYVLFAKFMKRGERKGYTNKGLPLDYTYPPVIIHNYTKPGSRDRVVEKVQKYINDRKLRSGGWYEGKARTHRADNGRFVTLG